jgi:hypothetical protein
MSIQHWAERAVRLPPEDHEIRTFLLRRKAYRFSPYGLQLDECRTGKTAKLIDLYARLRYANP